MVTKQVTGPPFAYTGWLAVAQSLDLLSNFPGSGQPGTLHSYGISKPRGRGIGDRDLEVPGFFHTHQHFEDFSQ